MQFYNHERQSNNNNEDAFKIVRISKLKPKEKRFSPKNSIPLDLMLIQPMMMKKK